MHKGKSDLDCNLTLRYLPAIILIVAEHRCFCQIAVFNNYLLLIFT